MARQFINAQRKGTRGGQVTLSAVVVADGIAYYANPGARLLVNNTSGAPCTVTILTPGVADAGALPDPTAVVAAGQLWEFDGYAERAAEYMQADGTVWVNFSVDTGIAVAVIT